MEKQLLERSGSWKAAKKKKTKSKTIALQFMFGALWSCAISQIVTELINWPFVPVNCFNIIGTRCLQVLNWGEQTVTKKSELTNGYKFYSLPY